jgi:NAD(P)-dependent dehydrogenase (short-subunit alcohol dehydrogenase family)
MAMLEGRVVAVTGAGRGIGREIALLCAREGAAVVVNDPGVSSEGEGGDAGPAAQTVADIRAAGGQAHANTASVTDPIGAASIVEDAVQRFGRIDAVVNNAGILRDRIWHKMSHEDWRAVLDVHLNGAFNVSKAATPYFKDQGSGSFIHFTSTSGLIGNFGQANYSAAKLGIVGLSQSIALDMARIGVRSNCIAPFAWSRMIATIPPTTPEEIARVERMKTMTADKIAPLVAFLASDASAEVTNQIFAVRKNEIFLFSKPRPIRSMHRSEGWSAETIASDLLPAFRTSFSEMERSTDIFPWDPV